MSVKVYDLTNPEELQAWAVTVEEKYQAQAIRLQDIESAHQRINKALANVAYNVEELFKAYRSLIKELERAQAEALAEKGAANEPTKEG